MATKRRKKRKLREIWTDEYCPDPATGKPPRKFHNETNWRRHLESEAHKRRVASLQFRRTDPEVRVAAGEGGGLAVFVIAAAILGVAIYYSRKGQ